MTTIDHLVLSPGTGDPARAASAPASGTLALVVSCVGGVVALTESLLWRLAVLKLVAAADEARYVGQAAAEVELVAAELADAEQARASLIARLAVEMGIPADELTLSTIANASPDGVAQALNAHRRRLSSLTDEMQAVSAQIRKHVSVNLRHLDAVLGDMHGKPTTYTADGRTAAPRTRPRVQRSF